MRQRTEFITWIVAATAAAATSVPTLARGEEDCNDNGIPDFDELSGCLGRDCNGNGVPDDCETGLGCSIRINEIRTGQNGADVDEYVELHGAPGTSLDGLAYVVLGDDERGNSGIVEAVVDLSGHALGPDGFFLVAEAGFTLGVPDLVAELNFEDDDNVTHMVVAGLTGGLGDDVDPDDDGFPDAEVYAGVIDVIWLAKSTSVPPAGTEWLYCPAEFNDCPTPIGPVEGTSPAHVYFCVRPGLENWLARTGPAFPAPVDSPGAANPVCPYLHCPGDFTADDLVGFVDLARYLALPDGPCCGCLEDLDGNGVKGYSDFLALLANYGPCCRPDLDDDEVVGNSDLIAVLTAWGECLGCRADLTGDGLVGNADLFAVLSAWGACP